MNPKAIRFAPFTLILGLCLVISLPVRAQVVGATLSGTLTDAQGLAISNVKISAMNLGTGVSTSTTTNATGAFSIANLNPADYEISASAAGFSTALTRVTLAVGAKQEVNLALKVGQVTQIVEVTGAGPAVETANSTLSAQVDSTTIRELALNGRDWASLATLQPGVASVRTQEQVGQQIGAHARGLGMQLSIGGNRPTQNTYRLNGLIINDYSNAGPGNVLGANLGVDAIQEFSVLTSNYSAEYGFTSGGVINAITRSGTNQFHGSAFEFIRNSVLDAANFFENASGIREPFRRNQFGGSAGGPIKKDKIFIFGAYEGVRQSKGIPQFPFTLSDNARKGILNDSSGVAIPTQPGNQACAPATVCVNSEIAKYFTFYPPCPSAAGLIGSDNNVCQYAFSSVRVVSDNFYNTRGDVKLSDKDSLNANYYYDRSTFSLPSAFNNTLDGFIVGRQGASLEETHVLGPSLVNTARLGYNRTYGFGLDTLRAINKASADASFGMFPGTFAPQINVFAGLGQFGGGLNGESVQNYTQQTYQVYDDAGHTVGNHNLKFGFMFLRYRETLFAPFLENGQVFFNSLQDFLTDNTLGVSGPPNLASIRPHDLFTSIPGLYIQDDWKVRRGLTLNLGLRYEMETIPIEAHGLVHNLPTPGTNPAPGNPVNTVFFTKNPTTKNFEPRIGFAWDPFHSGKTAVRGGFGIFDALPLPLELIINNAQTSPFHVVANVPGCSFVMQPPLPQPQMPCVPAGSFPRGVAGVLASPPISDQSWNYAEPAPKRNYIYQWNLNVQRQLGNLGLTVAYAGSRGFHNPFQIDDINTVFPTRTSAGWIFPNPVGSGVVVRDPSGNIVSQGPPCISECSTMVNPFLNGFAIAGVQTTLWQSKSWYNALEINIEKRMTHGLQVQGAFTWSKTEDTSSGSFAGDNFAGDINPTIPWWDLRIVKGLSDFNVGRNLVINALWQIPTPATFRGPGGWIARGWELGGIAVLSDGVPIWPLDLGPNLGQGNSEPIDFPDRVAGCSLTLPSSGRHGSLQYINPACFTNAQAPNQAFFNANCDPNPPIGLNGTPLPLSSAGLSPLTCFNLLGNLGRNTVIGPGLFNIDFSMVKDNHIRRISEAFHIQFRAEFFNMLNHTNFAPPVDNLVPFLPSGAPTPGFGRLDATQTPGREIQFALKMIW
jgi:carboxypeptidase family protein/TonB-dependent receptor-like protein